ncbi:hypothetical protein BJX99DRAFT_254779 [Aspergillus californicus]
MVRAKNTQTWQPDNYNRNVNSLFKHESHESHGSSEDEMEMDTGVKVESHSPYAQDVSVYQVPSDNSEEDEEMIEGGEVDRIADDWFGPGTERVPPVSVLPSTEPALFDYVAAADAFLDNDEFYFPSSRIRDHQDVSDGNHGRNLTVQYPGVTPIAARTNAFDTYNGVPLGGLWGRIHSPTASSTEQEPEQNQNQGQTKLSRTLWYEARTTKLSRTLWDEARKTKLAQPARIPEASSMAFPWLNNNEETNPVATGTQTIAPSTSFGKRRPGRKLLRINTGLTNVPLDDSISPTNTTGKPRADDMKVKPRSTNEKIKPTGPIKPMATLRPTTTLGPAGFPKPPGAPPLPARPVPEKPTCGNKKLNYYTVRNTSNQRSRSPPLDRLIRPYRERSRAGPRNAEALEEGEIREQGHGQRRRCGDHPTTPICIPSDSDYEADKEDDLRERNRRTRRSARSRAEDYDFTGVQAKPLKDMSREELLFEIKQARARIWEMELAEYREGWKSHYVEDDVEW